VENLRTHINRTLLTSCTALVPCTARALAFAALCPGLGLVPTSLLSFARPFVAVVWFPRPPVAPMWPARQQLTLRLIVPSVGYSCTTGAVDRKSIALTILQCYVQCLYTRRPIYHRKGGFRIGGHVNKLYYSTDYTRIPGNPPIFIHMWAQRICAEISKNRHSIAT
jgi:hypothetical protein